MIQTIMRRSGRKFLGWAPPLFLFPVFLAYSADSASSRVVEHPAGMESGEAHLCVFDDKLYMSWIESAAKHEGTLRFATYNGQGWSPPQTIYQSDRLFINWADFPKLIAVEDLLVSAWLEKNGGGTYAYGVRFSRSADGGKTWSAPGWLHQDQSESEHGFLSLAPDPAGGVAAIWLDGRAMARAEPGDMQLRYRNIQSRGMGPEVLLDASTCECCGTDLVRNERGLLAVYRHKTPKHVRDIYLAASEGGSWGEGSAIHNDGWEIHGCPVNGPALDGSGSLLAAAWFSGAEGSDVRLKLSDDHGRHFGNSVKVAGNALGRVDITILDSNHVAVLWLERGEDENLVKLARYKREGPTLAGEPLLLDKTPPGRVSGFPRMALLKGKLLIAYQSPTEKRIKVKEIAWDD